MKSSLPLLLAVSALTAASALGAFTRGGNAYTKRVETVLRAEPRSLAEPVARLGYARTVKIEEVKGPWLRVREGEQAGWVFSGNLAEEKPSEDRGVDGLPLAASQTTATAAARPLTPAAKDYAERKGATNAPADLEWLGEQSAAVTADAVQAFLESEKKGEFQ